MKLFLAFPFSQFLEKETSTLRPEIESWLKQAVQNFEKKHSVFLAHRREGWGACIMPPNVCTKLDYIEMQMADYVIAFPGSPISGGVHIELGWASALKKKVLLLLDQNVKYSPLIYGMNEVTQATFITYEELDEELIVKIEKNITGEEI